MITASQHGSCTSYHWNCKFIAGLVCSIPRIKKDISIHITRKMHICKMCISWLCYVNWNIRISPWWHNLDSRDDVASVLQTVQNRCFQKTRFCTNDAMTKNKWKQHPELQESVHQATHQKSEREDYLNIDSEVEIGTGAKKIDKFIEKCQHSKNRRVIRGGRKNWPEMTCGVQIETILQTIKKK
jgi:hypothetical protein